MTWRSWWVWASDSIGKGHNLLHHTVSVCCNCPTTKHSFLKRTSTASQKWSTEAEMCSCEAHDLHPWQKLWAITTGLHSGLASGITNSALIWPRSLRWASTHKQGAPLCRAQQASCDAATLVSYLPDANNGADSNARLLQVDRGGLLSGRRARLLSFTN